MVRGKGMGIGGRRQRDGGASICRCPNCGYTTKHNRGIPCNQNSCPRCGTRLVGQ